MMMFSASKNAVYRIENGILQMQMHPMDPMELRGVEPLSENPSNRTSSITAALLTFPPRSAGQQAYRFSSFMAAYQPAKLKADRFSLFMMPLAPGVSALRAT